MCLHLEEVSYEKKDAGGGFPVCFSGRDVWYCRLRDAARKKHDTGRAYGTDHGTRARSCRSYGYGHHVFRSKKRSVVVVGDGFIQRSLRSYADDPDDIRHVGYYDLERHACTILDACRRYYAAWRSAGCSRNRVTPTSHVSLRNVAFSCICFIDKTCISCYN